MKMTRGIAILLILVVWLIAFDYMDNQRDTALESLENHEFRLELVADTAGTYSIIMNGDTTRYSLHKKTQLY